MESGEDTMEIKKDKSRKQDSAEKGNGGLCSRLTERASCTVVVEKGLHLNYYDIDLYKMKSTYSVWMSTHD